MARYLSPEWFEEVRQAAGDDDFSPDAVLEQVVADGPQGRVVYRVGVAEGRARIMWPVPDDAPDPDLRITCGWPTSVAIATGALSTQRALMEGRLRVSGNPGRLSELAGRTGGLDPVPEDVRRHTTYALAV